jgi:hypothetical protein
MKKLSRNEMKKVLGGRVFCHNIPSSAPCRGAGCKITASAPNSTSIKCCCPFDF